MSWALRRSMFSYICVLYHDVSRGMRCIHSTFIFSIYSSLKLDQEYFFLIHKYRCVNPIFLPLDCAKIVILFYVVVPRYKIKLNYISYI